MQKILGGRRRRRIVAVGRSCQMLEGALRVLLLLPLRASSAT